jgi:5-methylthioadenosine/S-adenosylhomocysteine deaminase
VDVGPLDQTAQDVVQAAAAVGQRVLDLRWDGRKDGAGDESVAFESAKRQAQHPLRDAVGEASQLVEASRLSIQAADDDDRPLVADSLEHVADRGCSVTAATRALDGRHGRVGDGVLEGTRALETALLYVLGASFMVTHHKVVRIQYRRSRLLTARRHLPIDAGTTPPSTDTTEAMPNRDLLITDGYVATLDPAAGDLPHADLLIRDGRIGAIGPDLASGAPHARVIDAGGRLVLPGLVDTHRHVWQGAIGGATGQTSLSGYFGTVIAGLAPNYLPEDIYAGVLWGALQALDAGITTVADWSHNLLTPEHADANIQALHDAGLRAVFLFGGPGEEGLGWFADPERPHPPDARRVRAEHFPGGASGRLRMGLALRGPALSSREATRHDFDLARELDMPISIHVGMAGYPGAVAALDALGLLGPDVNYAHANQLSDHEYERIAATGGSISISPSVEMLMALGSHPATGRALEHGIRAGLSTDTVTGAGTDLFSEMRIALAAERSRSNAAAVARDEAVDDVELGQRDMLRLTTLDAARAWRMDGEIGSLAVGKQADIAIVDMRSPHLDGSSDPVTTLVMGAGAADVETVIVGGELIKHDGSLLEPLASRARQLMHESRDRLRARRCGRLNAPAGPRAARWPGEAPGCDDRARRSGCR